MTDHSPLQTRVMTIIACVLMILSASVQSWALAELFKIENPSENIAMVKKMLGAAVGVQFALAIIIIVLVIVARKSTTWVPKILMFLACAAFLAGGGLAVAASMKLQCDRASPHAELAYKACTGTGVLGVVGTFLIIIIRIKIQKQTVSGLKTKFSSSLNKFLSDTKDKENDDE